MNTPHDATVTAAEHRVSARRPLDDAQRGTLAAVQRHSPDLAPRVAEVLRADAEIVARKTRRAERASRTGDL